MYMPLLLPASTCKNLQKTVVGLLQLLTHTDIHAYTHTHPPHTPRESEGPDSFSSHRHIFHPLSLPCSPSQWSTGTDYESSVSWLQLGKNLRHNLTLEFSYRAGLRLTFAWIPSLLCFFFLLSYFLHSLTGFSWIHFLNKSLAYTSLSQDSILRNLS